MAKKLTERQAKFVEIYLSNGRKGSDAYRQAYNTTMSPVRCGQEAHKLLRNQATRDQLAAVQEIIVDELADGRHRVRIKLHDRRDRLLLGPQPVFRTGQSGRLQELTD